MTTLVTVVGWVPSRITRAISETSEPVLVYDLMKPDDLFRELARVFGTFDRIVPHGDSGKPSQGSAAEGETVLDTVPRHLGPFLRQLAAHDWQNGAWMSRISL